LSPEKLLYTGSFDGMKFTFSHPYSFAPAYSLPVTYFCMEYAIHQPLKIYAGGLGFLAGYFDSNRMAAEYYEKMYTCKVTK